MHTLSYVVYVVFESKRQRGIESDCGELPGNTAQ